MNRNYWKVVAISLVGVLAAIGNACGEGHGTLDLGGFSKGSSIGRDYFSGTTETGDGLVDLPTPTPSPSAPQQTYRTETVCETTDGAIANLDQWVNQHRDQGLTCGRFKDCQNCCGDDSRFDKFYASCATPEGLDASQLGDTSDSRCEHEGQDYLAGFYKAKTDAGFNCGYEKDCSNCCGPSSTLDKFHVTCHD